MIENLEGVKKRYDEITRQLSDPEIFSDQQAFRNLSKEHSELTPIVESYHSYLKLKDELRGQEEILADPEEDPELKAMATEEAPGLRNRLDELQKGLQILLLPRDPLDNSNVVLEIRAGTGGEEAGLFAGDLFRMYQRFAEERGWRWEPLQASPSEKGGFKEVVVAIEGNEVYRQLKFESGVHRVQRVPQTEAQGRIHTSAATVAVLPEADEIQVVLNPADLRIDVFRSSGPGGQSVNTTDSAVRITHLPTGLVAQSQDEKSQHKNKAKAMKVLNARIFERMREVQDREKASQRKSMVGTGDRSERIRTYNFPQSRVTDHRIGLTLYKLDRILEGDLAEIVNALSAHEETERLKEGR